MCLGSTDKLEILFAPRWLVSPKVLICHDDGAETSILHVFASAAIRVVLLGHYVSSGFRLIQFTLFELIRNCSLMQFFQKYFSVLYVSVVCII